MSLFIIFTLSYPIFTLPYHLFMVILDCLDLVSLFYICTVRNTTDLILLAVCTSLAALAKPLHLWALSPQGKSGLQGHTLKSGQSPARTQGFS